MLKRDDFLTIIEDIRNTEKVALDEYIEKILIPLQNSSEHFIDTLYKDINYILASVDSASDNDLAIFEGDIVLDGDDIQLTGYQTRLHDVSIWLHQQIIEKMVQKGQGPQAILNDLERLSDEHTFIISYTPEYRKKLDEIKESIRAERFQNLYQHPSVFEQIFERQNQPQKMTLIESGKGVEALLRLKEDSLTLQRRDYTVFIPDILKTATPEGHEPQKRTLAQLAELLKIAYELLWHPVLNKWKGFDKTDIFADAMGSTEKYALFNRTIIERTIAQAHQISQVELNIGILVFTSEGYERAIDHLDIILTALNGMYIATDKEFEYGEILMFRLTTLGQLSAQIQYFLRSCEDGILSMSVKHIEENLAKQKCDGDKYQFLLKQQAFYSKQQGNYRPYVYDGIMKCIDIDLNLYKELVARGSVSAEITDLIKRFLAEKASRISNGELRLNLLQNQPELFCQNLKQLVLRLLSYHDVAGKEQEQEKVYHMLLAGLFNDFATDFTLLSNGEAGLGRFDLMLVPDNVEMFGYIIEIKRALTGSEDTIKKILSAALSQVEDKQYASFLQSKGITNFCSIALVFYGKQCFTDYRVFPGIK